MYVKGKTSRSLHRKDFAISSRNEPDIDTNPSAAAQHILLAAFPFHEAGRL